MAHRISVLDKTWLELMIRKGFASDREDCPIPIRHSERFDDSLVCLAVALSWRKQCSIPLGTWKATFQRRCNEAAIAVDIIANSEHRDTPVRQPEEGSEFNTRSDKRYLEYGRSGRA